MSMHERIGLIGLMLMSLSVWAADEDATERQLIKQLIDNGSYDQFKIVQRIHEIVREAQKQVGNDLVVEHNPTPTFWEGQTEKGLRLKLSSWGFDPKSLETQWGEVSLFWDGIALDERERFIAAFFAYFTLAFEDIELLEKEISVCNSYYKIRAIEGRSLPEPTVRKKHYYRETNELSKEWKILKEMWQREQELD